MLRSPQAPFRVGWAALCAVAGGILGLFAFPRFGVWPAAVLSVALLELATTGRRARTGAWLGYLYGAAFLLPLLSWTGIYVGPAPWLILALAFAGFFALLGALATLLTRLPLAPAWIGAAWVLQEALRDRVPFGGFPWGRLAFSQAQSPMRWFAAVGGAPLVTFVTAAAGAALARAALAALPPGTAHDIGRTGAVSRTHPARGWRAVSGWFALACALPVLGLCLAAPLRPAPEPDRHSEVVALVQGGLPDLKLAFESRAEQVLDNHIAATRKLAAAVRAGKVARPGLVLWPENASDVDPFQDPDAYAKIDSAVRDIGAPVLVGAILQGPGPTHRRNVGILWSPRTGPGAQYVKRHPVPFAEYIPLRGLAEWISSDAKNVTQDMVAGHGDGLLRGAGAPIGDVICFEVAYDELVRSSVAAGAQLLVVQTNNATFGHTPETYQQLAMSQLRAVETGREVLQVATTGKSAVIAPDGAVSQESGPLFAADTLVARVPLRTTQTLATRLAAWPELVLSVFAVAGAAATAFGGWRRRRAGRPPVTPGTSRDDVAERSAAPGHRQHARAAAPQLQGTRGTGDD